MPYYIITLTSKAPFSRSLLEEYENVINKGLEDKAFRVKLECE